MWPKPPHGGTYYILSGFQLLCLNHGKNHQTSYLFLLTMSSHFPHTALTGSSHVFKTADFPQ